MKKVEREREREEKTNVLKNKSNVIRYHYIINKIQQCTGVEERTPRSWGIDFFSIHYRQDVAFIHNFYRKEIRFTCNTFT